MSQVLYSSAIESLMFAMVCTKPDFAKEVGAVCKYMMNLEGAHWTVVKRIFSLSEEYFRS
jgi:hypothetical protein